MSIKDIYSDPAFYDAFSYQKVNDIEFVLKRASIAGDPILELAAGTGRLALPLLENGYDYTGIDISEVFVKWARKKLASFEDNARLFVKDMRQFDLEKKYKFILLGYNSILHLLTDKDIADCFARVYDHLHNDGEFLIDLFIPKTDYLHRDPDKLYFLDRYRDEDGNVLKIAETTIYDPRTQISHIEWYHTHDEASKPDIYEFDMHMIYPDTMDRLLTDAGFVIRHKFGDYDESQLNPDSHLQIYICGKK
jgi:SAM-dependent methyltransferase